MSRRRTLCNRHEITGTPMTLEFKDPKLQSTMELGQNIMELEELSNPTPEQAEALRAMQYEFDAR